MLFLGLWLEGDMNVMKLVYGNFVVYPQKSHPDVSLDGFCFVFLYFLEADTGIMSAKAE